MIVLADNSWIDAFVLVSVSVIVIGLAAMILSWRASARAEKRHRRLSYGRCMHCDYDRRGTQSMLCPECRK
jgi:hypothetical protein